MHIHNHIVRVCVCFRDVPWSSDAELNVNTTKVKKTKTRAAMGFEMITIFMDFG